MKPELAKVGPAWDGGDIQKWPGVAGVQGVTNHLDRIKTFLPDPVNSSSTRGGKRKSKSKRKASKKAKKKSKQRKRTMKKQRGGSTHGNTLLPQQLVNLGRNVEYSLERLFHSLRHLNHRSRT